MQGLLSKGSHSPRESNFLYNPLFNNLCDYNSCVALPRTDNSFNNLQASGVGVRLPLALAQRVTTADFLCGS